jgi:hypothetical protein
MKYALLLLLAAPTDELPKRHKDSLHAGTLKVGDTTLVSLEMPQGDPGLAGLGFWDEKGDHFYTHSSRTRKLYRIRFDRKADDLIKDAEAETGPQSRLAGLSSERLIMADSSFGKEELRVVDPLTLKVIRSVPTRTRLAGRDAVATHPELPVAVVADRQYVQVVDLKAGKVLGENIIKEKGPTRGIGGFRHPHLAADGKAVYCSGAEGDDRLFRLRVDKGRVTLDAAVALPEGRSCGPIRFTPDGRYLAHFTWPRGGRSRVVDFYKPDDLARPAFSSGEDLAAPALDGKGNLFATLPGKKQLAVFPADGKGDPKTMLWLYDQLTYELLPRPDGGAFLAVIRAARADGKTLVFYVETPR